MTDWKDRGGGVGETHREDGHEDKYVKGGRWDGKSRITKEKGEKKEKGESVTLWPLHSFNIIIKKASTGNVIIPKCEMCV